MSIQDWRALEVQKALIEAKEVQDTIIQVRRYCNRSQEDRDLIHAQAAKLASLSHTVLRYLDQEIGLSEDQTGKLKLQAQNYCEYARESARYSELTYLEIAVRGVQSIIRRVPQGSFIAKMRKHFKIVNVAGDGSCGFRALIKSLNPECSPEEEAVSSQSLRATLVNYLKENSERLSIGEMYYIREEDLVPFDEYIEYMAKPDTFADELAMKALSEILQRPIFIYNEGTTSFEDAVPRPVDTARLGEEFDAKPLHLLKVGEHFQALFPRL